MGKQGRIIGGYATMYKQIMKLFITGVVLGAAIPVAAQDEAPVSDDIDDSTRSCITLRSLRHTDVIDDRNVVFRMRGNTVYHNILRNQCGGLAREGRFSYDSGFGRLCENDMIRVLHADSFGAFGMREGAGCKLGPFHKITREDAKALKEAPLSQPTPAQLPMPAPQEVGVGNDKSEEPEGIDEPTHDEPERH